MIHHPVRSFRRFPALALALSVAALPGPVLAAAWTMPAGHGQVIATTIVTTSPRGFDADGQVSSIATYDKAELYVLAEYGLTDRLTLAATPSLSHVSVGGQPLAGNGLGFTELALRWRATGSNKAPLSLQGSVRIPGQSRSSALSQIAAQGTEVDLRALYGRTLKLGSVPGYANIEAAYRWRGGAPANEVHIDATLGLRPAARLTLLAQSFNTLSSGQGAPGYGKSRFANVGASAIYDLSRSVGLQLGVTGTLAGRNALRERGVAAAIWFHF